MFLNQIKPIAAFIQNKSFKIWQNFHRRKHGEF